MHFLCQVHYIIKINQKSLLPEHLPNFLFLEDLVLKKQSLVSTKKRNPGNSHSIAINSWYPVDNYFWSEKSPWPGSQQTHLIIIISQCAKLITLTHSSCQIMGGKNRIIIVNHIMGLGQSSPQWVQKPEGDGSKTQDFWVIVIVFSESLLTSCISYTGYLLQIPTLWDLELLHTAVRIFSI